MKTSTTILIAMMAMIMIASFASLTLAQESTTNTDVSASTDTSLNGNPGITPDSGLYGLKLGWEKFRLAFIFNQELKAQKELQLAHQRLIEARAMADKGDNEGFQKAESEYEVMISRAQARLSAIDKDGNADKIKASAKGVVGLETAIQVHQYNIDRLRDRIANANLTDEQRAKFEANIDKMENKTDDLKEKLSDREDKIKTKLRAVTNKSEEEADKEIADIEKSVNFTATLQKVANDRINKAQESLDKLKTRLANKELKVNTTIAQERIDLATASIADAQKFYDEGKYEEAIRAIKPFGNFGREISEIKKDVNEARKEAKETFRDSKEKAKELLKDAKDKAKEEVKQAREKIKEGTKDNKSSKNDSSKESDDDNEEASVSVNTSVSLTA